jgi:transposase
MSRRHELSDEQWEHIQPVLPPQKAQTGRPGNDHRTMLNGMIWIARTGAPWRDLPERYGKWTSVYSRFQRWRKAGIWDRIWSELQRQEDAAGKIDWEIHFVDGTVVRAHQHAAGAKKVAQKPKR